MIQVTLILDDQGYLSVTGPVDDKAMVLGILELGKHVVLTDTSWAAISDGISDAANHTLRQKVQES